jgi:heme oxygenase
LSFFNAYDEEEKQMWGLFRDRLDAYPAGVDASYEMIKSAKQTFECFHEWIQD